MKNKVKKVKGFQMNKITGHASLSFWQKDYTVKSVGFTHNKEDIADKVPLKHNINPKDNSPCFAKTKVEKQRYNTYREKLDYKDYRVHDEDKPIIKEIILADKKNGEKKNKKRR